MADKRAYTVEDAADMLSVSRDLIYDLMRTGKLRYVQVTSKKRLIPADAVSELLNGRVTV
jgi:excisionase family DNA binding protein